MNHSLIVTQLICLVLGLLVALLAWKVRGLEEAFVSMGDASTE